MIRSALLFLIRGYQLLVSPWLGPSCRFEPNCSRYAVQAIEQHGAAGGSYLTLARVVRCQPWCQGGDDPVPAQIRAPRLFTHLLSPSSEKKSS